MVCNEKHKQTNTNKKCNHKYVQNEINIPGLSVMLDAISQIFQCSGFVIQRPFPPLWKKPIPSLCAAADVRWLEGLCSLTVGTDYQKRDTTYKGQISIRIRSGTGTSGNQDYREIWKIREIHAQDTTYKGQKSILRQIIKLNWATRPLKKIEQSTTTPKREQNKF